MELHNPTLRVLRILKLIDAYGDGISLAEISDKLDMPKGTISPILKTLAATDYIRLEGSQYRIGAASFVLGLSYSSGANALSIIQKEMKALVADVEEVCQMGVLDETNVYYLQREDSNTRISIISEVGKRIPAHVTAVGKALLAGKSEEEIRSLYQGYTMEAYTENSIQTLDELLRQVDDVRLGGFAYENEESSVGICCTAIPLVLEDTISAAISVAVPSFRYTPEKQECIRKELKRRKELIESSCRIHNYKLEF